jgi:hypothetical protein
MRPQFNLKHQNMKKIIIELTDEQYEKMKAYQKRGSEINGEGGTLSGCGIKLCCTEIEDWLEIEMNGVLNLGEVNWKIE